MTHLNVACGCLHGSTYRWKDGHVRFFFWHNDLLNDCYCKRSVTTKGQLGRSQGKECGAGGGDGISGGGGDQNQLDRIANVEVALHG